MALFYLPGSPVSSRSSGLTRRGRYRQLCLETKARKSARTMKAGRKREIDNVKGHRRRGRNRKRILWNSSFSSLRQPEVFQHFSSAPLCSPSSTWEIILRQPLRLFLLLHELSWVKVQRQSNCTIKKWSSAPFAVHCFVNLKFFTCVKLFLLEVYIMVQLTIKKVLIALNLIRY